MPTFAQDPIHAFDDAIAAFSALSDLVTTAIGNGDDFSRLSYGVSVMFDQHTAMLNQVREYVAQAVAPAAKADSTAKLREIIPAGFNMVMVIEPDGRRYMTTPALAGVSAEGTTKPRFADESPMDIRKRVIADLVGDGKVAGDIAQAMGLKKDTVERVIGQLLSREPTATTSAPASTKQAVNG